MIKPIGYTWEGFLAHAKEYAKRRPLPAKFGDLETNVRKIWDDESVMEDTGNGKKFVK